MERSLSNLTVEKIRQLKIKLRRFETPQAGDDPAVELATMGTTEDPESEAARSSPTTPGQWTQERDDVLDQHLVDLLNPNLTEEETLQLRSALKVRIKKLIFPPFFSFFFFFLGIPCLPPTANRHPGFPGFPRNGKKGLTPIFFLVFPR